MRFTFLILLAARKPEELTSEIESGGWLKKENQEGNGEHIKIKEAEKAQC